MHLFDTVDLFMTGRSGKKEFDLPDADVMLMDNFFTKQESDDYYRILLADTLWHKYERPMYTKTVTAPRMISWYQDKNDDIASKNTPELTPCLKQIRTKVENETHLKFNAVLLNLYRNGRDSISWHSDKIERLGENPVIVSVTFGATRLFRLRHKFRKDIQPVSIPLHHGSFLIMAGKTNSFWEHQVPKTTRNVLPRINLTFRSVFK